MKMKASHKQALTYLEDQRKAGAEKVRFPINDAKMAELIEGRGWRIETPFVVFPKAKAISSDTVMSKKSKKYRLLMLLLDGRKLSVHDTLKEIGLNALSQRIGELRRDLGFEIETEIRHKGSDQYGVYSINDLDKAKELARSLKLID